MKVVHYVQLFLIMLAPAAVNFGHMFPAYASIAATVAGVATALAAALVPISPAVDTTPAVTPIAPQVNP